MRHFLHLNDLSKEDILYLVELANRLKKEAKRGFYFPYLKNKALGLIFTKASTRTRVSFEVGIHQLGGYSLYLGKNDLQLGRGETIEDTAKVLSRYLDLIVIRTYEQKEVEEFAKYSSIPVINGLTDDYHPTQIIADFQTIFEEKGRLSSLKIAYVGDGNNVAATLLVGAAKLGLDIAVATPPGYEIKKEVVDFALDEAKKSKSNVIFTYSPKEAVKDADVVYTDTWVSMGQEEEKEKRIRDFERYQVDTSLMRLAKDDAIFLHCLPAYRGFEVTSEVIDGPQSRVFDEAENRLHAHKAIMIFVCLGKI
ncbi:ornithine carbamoyltransferase [Caldicellulosiruptor acetigenus]|uniref:ornithine carbamoyltransferase n=1 Tax=Caldicellulosiruptor acetigenus TaxID=301953 RepID=UPI0003FE4B0F|nr:ornithine carbamoyltransferase [Caldicellulosiruptor acetigenus]WAM37351.1 ornithine carbamoyltransferase [Caldicellulosiruptor acetigenus]